MKHMFIEPNWPAPSNVKAFTTLRIGGVSEPPYDQFNLALHVGDKSEHVKENRQSLVQALHLPNEPIWINQTHSTIAIEAKDANRDKEADAAFTQQANQVCIILTADCLPILLCNQKGTYVAAIHAGWRGLLNGIIETTLQGLQLPNYELLAWLGPAIGQKNYEVGNEVREQFVAIDTEAEKAFLPSPNGRWLANLYALARLRLAKAGISSVFGGDLCTFDDAKKFYSYRRDGSKTGRMASLIWIKD